MSVKMGLLAAQRGGGDGEGVGCWCCSLVAQSDEGAIGGGDLLEGGGGSGGGDVA